MSCKSNELIGGDIFIQRGVRKIYNSDVENVMYVIEFDMDIKKRDGYCIDSRNVDKFFYMDLEYNKCRMIPFNNYRFSERYILLDEFDRGYISLFDFIMNGKFVGREFRRFFPVITYCGIDRNNDRIIDNRYLDIGYYDNKYIVLYEKDNTFLVKYIYGNNECYGIVDCRYIQDGMYEFVGDIYLEYMDRESVYLDIVKQLDISYRNYIKKKIKVR